jgi:SAM-dependent methyltransferase
MSGMDAGHAPDAEVVSGDGVRNYAQDNITRYWTARAEAYDGHELSRIHRGAAQPAWTQIWAGAMPAPRADVLDVGTGTGFVALLLAGLGHRVAGIDLARGMLAAARARAADLANPPALGIGDAVAPPFARASFDVITSRYLLWTLRDPRRALANWKDLLRPQGRLLAVDAPWHDDGIHNSAARADPSQREFLRLYDDRVISALPLAEAQGIQDAVALIRKAGFEQVQAVPLPQIERIQRSLSTQQTTRSNLRVPFLIAARNG